MMDVSFLTFIYSVYTHTHTHTHTHTVYMHIHNILTKPYSNKYHAIFLAFKD
jgi:hypothetical protein